MYEAYLTVMGTVITDPIKRTTQSGDEVLSFRVASNSRRLDRESGQWHDGDTLYASVSCWRRLVAGVGASLMKGDSVIVFGQAHTNEYTTKDGIDRTDLQIRASAVGPDLARCRVKVDRSRPAVEREEQSETAEDDKEPAPELTSAG
ncbi:MAG: single-stranded DNA-binding protein [Rhodococcus sp. (in: high G+C Gram-positive bacteria)]